MKLIIDCTPSLAQASREIRQAANVGLPRGGGRVNTQVDGKKSRTRHKLDFSGQVFTMQGRYGLVPFICDIVDKERAGTNTPEASGKKRELMGRHNVCSRLRHDQSKWICCFGFSGSVGMQKANRFLRAHNYFSQSFYNTNNINTCSLIFKFHLQFRQESSMDLKPMHLLPKQIT